MPPQGKPTPPSRVPAGDTGWGRFALTLLTAGILTGFYLAYSMVINPIVQSPELSRNEDASNLPPAPPPMQGIKMAERWLPSQPWAADAKSVIRTDQAFIYFEDYELLDNDEAVRFTPFAMIWVDKDPEPDKQPYTVVSQSAYIKFAKKFDFKDPDPGRVIGGSLEGDVAIHGPDELKVSGRNFLFAENAMQIWCDGQVKFHYGPHHGHGHGLQVHLIEDPVAKQEEKLAVKGFRQVLLRRNVSMDLQFQGGSASAGLTREKNDDQSQKTTIVKVRSAGPFEFDVERNIATFRDEVRVYQPTAEEEYNSLESDRMTLFFESAEDASTEEVVAESGEESERFQGLNSQLKFKRMQADGRQVVLRSERNQLTATMNRLDYDIDLRTAKLSANGTVRVLQRRSEMNAPEIELIHREGGEVDRVWCRGDGWLTNLEKNSDDVEFAAKWSDELRKYPDPAGELDIIELLGNVQVRQPKRQFGLASDVMRLWLEPQSRRSETQPGDVENPSERMQPKRLLALQNVAIVSPDLEGRTKRLEAFFEPFPAPGQPIPQLNAQASPPIVPDAPGVMQPVKHADFANVPESEPVIQHVAFRAEDTATPAVSVDDENPIHLTADLLKVMILQGQSGRKSHISEAHAQNGVRVVQFREGPEKPLTIDGNRLHVVNPPSGDPDGPNADEDKNDQIMTIFGTPAHVRDRGLLIEGKEIFLDRAKNQSAVRGKGLLQLPVKRSLDGQQLEQPMPLDIHWNEQMTFDGKQANFYGQVAAVLGDSNLHCAEMQVFLTERIDFSTDRRQPGLENRTADGTQGETSNIELVVCKDNVQFDSYLYEDKKITEVRSGNFSEFRLNQTTGDTDATGPGWIKVWRRGNENRAALAPNAKVQANVAAAKKRDGWDYLKIDFHGPTVGNINQRVQTFQDRVQVVYGPVERYPQTVDPDRLATDAGLMQCDRLQFTQLEDKNAAPVDGKKKTTWVELFAEGNAIVEGRTFQGRADTITFDERKGKYVLHSKAPHHATIWRQERLGGPRSKMDAQRWEFVPANNTLKKLKSDGATGFEVVN